MTNPLHKTCPLRVVLEVDADFADLFEVKDGVIADREVIYTHDRASLTLAYRHAGFPRSVTIAASSPLRQLASVSSTTLRSDLDDHRKRAHRHHLRAVGLLHLDVSTGSRTPIRPQTAPTSTNSVTYSLQAYDVGKYVFSEVTITNANGQINATSHRIGPIAS